MVYINRQIEDQLQSHIQNGRSVLLLGPRQTGKTTLLAQLQPALAISFISPRVRQRYELDPDLLADEIRALKDNKPLVVVDEVQKVPLIMDVVQDLIDQGIAQFILTGSSARKLKRGDNINLLPGRVMPLHLDPLTIDELPIKQRILDDLLLFGALPDIALTNDVVNKEMLLEAYVTIYLEEEIRSEALVRNLASFARFLELAANEAGYTVNYSKLSQQIGVAHTTIANYYQILEDCLVAERVEPYTMSKTRHKLSQSNRYLIFDLGVRRIAAHEGANLSNKTMGHLFEQFVGLELIHQSRLISSRIKIKYWQDLDGPEVDWLIEFEKKLLPIEVKYTDKPNIKDAKHLLTFLHEYDNADVAFIVCQAPRKMKLSDNVYAIPWQDIHEIIARLT